MPLSRASSLTGGGREALFQTLMTPRGSRPPSPTFSPQYSSPRSRACAVQRLVHILLAASTGLLLLMTAMMYLPDADLYEWKHEGCMAKMIDMNAQLNTTLAAAYAANLIPENLGRPTTRRPRVAIVNAVKFHTEVVAALVYAFTKLNQNVTVYARDDALGMARVTAPWHWRPARRIERFYNEFYAYDTIVFATFPTCHLTLASALAATDLPQRLIGVVHNPEALAAAGAEAAKTAAAADIRLLTIAPHVNDFTNDVLKGEGMDLWAQWFAPIFPVLFPEDCGSPGLMSPSGAAIDQPACNRTAVWRDTDVSAPGSVLEADEEAWVLEEAAKRRRLAADEGNTEEPQPWPPVDHDWEVFPLGPPPGPSRQGFCVQGKLDPARRSYDALFAEIRTRRVELLASDFSLVLQGKGGGRLGADVLAVPSDLEEQGLVRRYASLPFQEYYEVLHACVAIVPAFANDAYYRHKGSSSVAAALISGTPLIVTPRALAAYSFLDASAVYLVPEGTGEVDAMAAVMGLAPEVGAAKTAALKALRARLYARNLVELQAVLGEEYLYKKKGRDGQYEPVWYDGSGPLWTAEPLRRHQ